MIIAASNKLSEMGQPNPSDVMEAVKDLPTTGILAQDENSGMVYLKLQDEWVLKALEVLKDYGYIFPPWRLALSLIPLGAHIRVVNEKEAVDLKLVSQREGKKEIPQLGKTVDFKVLDAGPFYPRRRDYGIESRYDIRVESVELEKIRMDLTRLPPTDHGFCINVGVRMEDKLEKTEKKPTIRIISVPLTSKHSDDEEIKDPEVAPASKSKSGQQEK